MSREDISEERVSLEEAVRRLVGYSKDNSNKIATLEGQIDEICQNFTEYRERRTCSDNEEIRNMVEKINAMQVTTTEFQQETNHKFEELKMNWDNMYAQMKGDMHQILVKLSEVPEPITLKLPKFEDEGAVTEGDKERLDNKAKPRFTPERRFRFMDGGDDFTARRSNEMSPYLTHSDVNRRGPLLPVPSINQMKQSIIIPPASAAPAFYGKPTESPTQFLIRVQEYAESVHAWDRATLVNGISQFLRDSALEWYCQLRLSHRRPQTWTEFEDAFLAQFNSPIRKARQEQEWHECKQKENETMNEFLVRLRALWREQKPKETETDLVKHLFRRMRNDILTMIGVSRNASLDEVMSEAQQIEDILYRRAKSERLTKQIKPVSSSSADSLHNKRYDGDNTRRPKPWRNREETYNRKVRDHQVNVITPRYDSNNQRRATAEPNQIRPLESPNCFKCGKYGHWATDCFTPYRAQRPTQNSLIPKNIEGALAERTSLAPI